MKRETRTINPRCVNTLMTIMISRWRTAPSFSEEDLAKVALLALQCLASSTADTPHGYIAIYTRPPSNYLILSIDN